MRCVGIASAVFVLAIAAAGVARAVPPGFTVEFDGQGEGKVTFAGAKHTGPGMHCSNCHMEVFYVNRSAQITRADHKRKQFCFVCHDGEQAFASRGNCERCHVEPEQPPTEPTMESPTDPPAEPTGKPTTAGPAE
jgi:c(7)-type cytochrome triheme protein